MILSRLPRELSQRIFLMLDGVSLHTARQACRDWNEFIIKEIWERRGPRQLLERRLKKNWSEATPSESLETLAVGTKPELLGMTENYIVIRILRDQPRRVTRSQRNNPDYDKVMIIIDPKTNSRQEIVMDRGPVLDVQNVDFGQAFLYSSTLICELLTTFKTVVGLAAWNLRNGQRILCKSFPCLFSYSPLQDVKTGQILLNSAVNNTPSILRLSIEADQVKETFLETKDLGSLAAWQSPYLLCHDPELEKTLNLCTIHGDKVERVSRIVMNSLDYDILSDRLLILSPYLVKVAFGWGKKPRVHIWSWSSGEILKTRPLPLPVPLESVYPAVHGVAQESNHLILRLVRVEDKKHLIIVYDIEKLLTHSKAKARFFLAKSSTEFGHSYSTARMVVTKTSVMLSDVYGMHINLFSWNFWK